MLPVVPRTPSVSVSAPLLGDKRTKTNTVAEEQEVNMRPRRHIYLRASRWSCLFFGFALFVSRLSMKKRRAREGERREGEGNAIHHACILDAMFTGLVFPTLTEPGLVWDALEIHSPIVLLFSYSYS